TTYSSHFTKPQAGKQMHVIIVNNKRTEQLAQDDFRSSLKCIRCAACFNTCPVYRRSGGHSYH
ncbi:MAG TPA: 4Fe-4S ferredoxin, partial [Chitinophagaceae bacterium]|nr:4Fe-4S ferredoxin [Chitinophagaceae bacterium]